MSLFHLADWIYLAKKEKTYDTLTFIDDKGSTKSVSDERRFANTLGQSCREFQLIRGIANSAKHLELRPVPAGRITPPNMPSHAANTFVSGPAFSPDFDPSAFDQGEVKLEGSNDIAFASLATATMGMWNRLLAANGW